MRGVTCLQTDDTLYLGDKAFMDKEETCSKPFECNPSKFLINQNSFNLNGITISLQEKYVTLPQPRHVAKLERIFKTEIDLSFFVLNRACGAYIAYVALPDLTYSFSKSSQVVTPNKTDICLIKKASNVSKDINSRGLRSVPFELESIRLIVFANASFVSNKDNNSQLGFAVALADKSNTANIVRFSSFKAKRVT